MSEVILVLNCGSSSIKFSVFTLPKPNDLKFKGVIDLSVGAPCFSVFNEHNEKVFTKILSEATIDTGIESIAIWFQSLSLKLVLTAVGHRVVHGGKSIEKAVLITPLVMNAIAKLAPFAPLHQSQNRAAIEIMKKLYPNIPQYACFDTTFHRTQEKLATLFAIPKVLSEQGMVRYGFHGISYDYIASVLTNHLGDIGEQRVIVAHLGNGASMCALHHRQSVATSMGLTALDGLMMGTRCGTIDPGLLLYLLQEQNYSAQKLQQLLYLESGLLGVSGISHDVRELLSRDEPEAKEAVDLFCYRAALEFGALTAALGGCDALVFTAGIGENCSIIRQKICERLQYIGIDVDTEANNNHAAIISYPNSPVVVAVIPTNEEYMMATYMVDS